MVVHGHVKNGVIVIDEPVTLPEGEIVQISVLPKLSPTTVAADENDEDADAPTWGEVFKDWIGKAEGLPSDSSVNHDHYLYGTPKR